MEMSVNHRHRYLLASALCVSLFLCGCMNLGPRYKRPDAPLPEEWKAGHEMGQWKPAEPADDQPKGKWWRIFNDETLNGLQELALENNQQLQSAMASVARARAVARVSSADFYPTLELAPDYEKRRRSANTSGSSDDRGSVSSRYSVPLDLSYELDIWGRVRKAFEAGVADMEASVAEYYTVLLTLTADVAVNYFSIRELDKELEVVSEAIQLREHAYDVVDKLVSGGMTSALDLNQAKTELARAKAEKVDIERRRKELENALAVLCGRPASEFRVEHAPLDLEPPVIPVSVPSTLLERRPDIAQAERRVAAANARVGVAKAAPFPMIRLTGSAGYESASTSDLFSWDSRIWSLGPSVSIPLFSGGRDRASLAAFRADHERTVADYRRVILEAIADVEISLINLEMRARQAGAQAEVVAASRASAELSMSRYQQGLVTFLEVIDAERSRLDAELTATQILNQRLISSVRLIKALGGGWDGG